MRTVKEAKADGVPLLAAGVAFYFLLALAPALTALDRRVRPGRRSERRGRTGARPAGGRARRRCATWWRSSSRRPPSASAARRCSPSWLGTVLALWSASAGVQHLIQAINTAYDEDETRGFVKVRGLAAAPVDRRHRLPRRRRRA